MKYEDAEILVKSVIADIEEKKKAEGIEQQYINAYLVGCLQRHLMRALEDPQFTIEVLQHELKNPENGKDSLEKGI